MTDKPLPSHATFYVAHAVANDVLVKLAYGLAANLTVTAPDDREHGGVQVLADMLEAFMPAADFKPHEIARTLPELGPYDADEAESIAMEIVGDALALIRSRFVR